MNAGINSTDFNSSIQGLLFPFIPEEKPEFKHGIEMRNMHKSDSCKSAAVTRLVSAFEGELVSFSRETHEIRDLISCDASRTFCVKSD